MCEVILYILFKDMIKAGGWGWGAVCFWVVFFFLLELCAALSRATGSSPKQRQRHQRTPKGCLYSEMQKSGRMMTTWASICSAAHCQCKWLQAAGETDKLTTVALISINCSTYLYISVSAKKYILFYHIYTLLNIFSFVAAASMKGCVWFLQLRY